MKFIDKFINWVCRVVVVVCILCIVIFLIMVGIGRVTEDSLKIFTWLIVFTGSLCIVCISLSELTRLIERRKTPSTTAPKNETDGV